MVNSVVLVRAALVALTLVMHCSALYANDSLGVYFKLESFTYSETVPIDAALHEWETTDFESGDRQWSWNWLEMGVQWGHFSLGYLWREEYDLRFSPDTAELYWRTANQLDLAPNTDYEIDLRARHFQASGLRFAFRNHHAFTVMALDYQLGFARFEAQDLIDGRLVGRGRTINNRDYDYVAELNYHYSEDRLFERQVEAPSGTGYAVDLALQAEYRQHRLSVVATDLVGAIYWRDAPYTEGTLNSDNKRYDASGYVRVNPTLSGYEGVSDEFRQPLQTRITADYDYAVSDRLAVGLMLQQQYDQALLAPSVALLASHALKLGYWPQTEMLQLQWRTPGWVISLGADGIDEGIRALALRFAYQPLLHR